MNTVRLTVTTPMEKYRRIEKEKKEKGLTRSAFVNRALDYFFGKEDEAMKDARYVAGYKNKPENLNEIKALEKTGVQSFGEF